MKIKLVLLALALVLPVVAAQGKTQARTGAKSKPAPTASAPKFPLNEEQKRAIQKLRSESKLKGALIAARLAQSAIAFDDNILSDAPTAEADAESQKGITDALAEATALRLQMLREVVARLTPQQQPRLKEEMSKPGAPPEGLLDVMSRLFKLPE